MDIGGKVKTYTGSIPTLLPWELIDLQLSIMAINRISKQISLLKPWTSKNAFEYDKQSVEEWINKNMWTDAAKRSWRAACKCIFGMVSAI